MPNGLAMRSVTPNLKKRSYLLPPGCKDLIDVLQPMKVSQASKSPTVSNEAGKISDISKHIHRFLKSGRALLIHASDENFGFALVRFQPKVVSASVDFPEDAAREARVRAWFTRHGLDAPKVTEIPLQFPEAPVCINFPVKPFPSSTRRLIAIATSVFPELCNATHETTLRFCHYSVDLC